MSKVVSFINMKGGVGKTTLAVNVAYTLATKLNKKVLLIDVDPQMNASQYTLEENQVYDILQNPNKSIYGIFKNQTFPSVVKQKTKKAKSKIATNIFSIAESFDIIPSHLHIMTLNLDSTPLRLNHYIDKMGFKDKYDLIILDSPPTISGYTKVSLLASDYYIVPMKIDFFSLFGLPLLQSYIDNLVDEFDLDLGFLGIILTMTRPDLNIYQDVKDRIINNKKWNEKLFTTELKHKTIVARSLSPGSLTGNSRFIINLKDRELNTQIEGISIELMQKLKI